MINEKDKLLKEKDEIISKLDPAFSLECIKRKIGNYLDKTEYYIYL